MDTILLFFHYFHSLRLSKTDHAEAYKIWEYKHLFSITFHVQKPIIPFEKYEYPLVCTKCPRMTLYFRYSLHLSAFYCTGALGWGCNNIVRVQYILIWMKSDNIWEVLDWLFSEHLTLKTSKMNLTLFLLGRLPTTYGIMS